MPQAVLIIQTIAPHLRGDDEKMNVVARSVATKQSRQKEEPSFRPQPEGRSGEISSQMEQMSRQARHDEKNGKTM